MVEEGAPEGTRRLNDVHRQRNIFGRIGRFKVAEIIREDVGPVAGFIFRRAPVMVVGRGVGEGARAVVSWSGVAGLVGGGIVGTLVAGAAVGAAAALAIEYGRQVNQNLNTRVAIRAETDPDLVGRKKVFLAKIKELQYTDVYKPTDGRKLLKAALVGALTGAVAGGIREHWQGIKNFLATREQVKEVAEGFVSKADYDSLVQQNLAQDKQIEELQKQNQALRDQVQVLQNQVVEAKPPPEIQRKLDTLLSQNRDLQQQLIEAVTAENRDLKHKLEEIRQAVAVKPVASVVGVAVAPDPGISLRVIEAVKVLDRLDNQPLSVGSNLWEFSTDTFRHVLGHDGTPDQIMAFSKILSRSNEAAVPEWMIIGSIDARNLPIGFRVQITDDDKNEFLRIAGIN